MINSHAFILECEFPQLVPHRVRRIHPALQLHAVYLQQIFQYRLQPIDVLSCAPMINPYAAGG